MYEVDPLAGTVRPVEGLGGTTLIGPESGESWGIVRRADGRLSIVDFDAQQSMMVFPADAREPNGLRQFPDNRRALVYFTDKTSEIWDIREGRVVKQIRTPQSVGFARVSPDGRWLAAALWGNELWIWDTATWEAKAVPRIGAWATSLTFSPDGTRLLAGTFDDRIEVRDVASGHLLGKLIGHSQPIDDAAFSPDGRRIVTASDDRTVRLWDAETFRELTSLAGHRDRVFMARFTSNGESIISIDALGNAMMWLTKAPQGAGIK